MTFRRTRCAHCRAKLTPERPSQIVHAECAEPYAIAKHFGWASANAAQAHINALLKHRLVERNACGKLRFVRATTNATE